MDKDLICKQYANLVESEARKFLYNAVPLDDLLQEAYIGLLTACDGYNPAAGTKFITYATHCIRSKLLHFHRDRASQIIREPRWLQEIALKVHRSTQFLTQKHGKTPTVKEIALHSTLNETDVKKVLDTRARFNVGVLDDASFNENFELSFEADTDTKITLRDAIADLNPIEQDVIYSHFYDDLSVVEIAKSVSLSAVEVDAILLRSLASLRGIIEVC